MWLTFTISFGPVLVVSCWNNIGTHSDTSSFVPQWLKQTNISWRPLYTSSKLHLRFPGHGGIVPPPAPDGQFDSI